MQAAESSSSITQTVCLSLCLPTVHTSTNTSLDVCIHSCLFIYLYVCLLVFLSICLCHSPYVPFDCPSNAFLCFIFMHVYLFARIRLSVARSVLFYLPVIPASKNLTVADFSVPPFACPSGVFLHFTFASLFACAPK